MQRKVIIKYTLKITHKNLYIQAIFKAFLWAKPCVEREGAAERGTVTSGITGRARVSWLDPLLFSQGESVSQVEEAHGHRQGDTAPLVRAVLTCWRHAEGVERDRSSNDLSCKARARGIPGAPALPMRVGQSPSSASVTCPRPRPRCARAGIPATACRGGFGLRL